MSHCVRCPGCQYELWNLRAPTCPECGRGFTLSQWDFEHPGAPRDVRFACNACGAVLDGRLPGDLPLGCPACRAPIDRQAAMVVPGGSGEGVPPVADGASPRRLLARAATGVMFLAAALGLFLCTVMPLGSNGSDGSSLLMFVFAGIAVGFFGAWPRSAKRRALVVVSLCVLVVAGLLGMSVYFANNASKNRQGLWFATHARHIAQGVLIDTQDQGAFPQDPGALVGQGVVPIDAFFPRQHPPATLSWQALADGWIMAGSFAIDWSPASWRADPPVVTLIAHPTDRLARTPFGSGDASVELLGPTAPQSLQPWNADRAAQGLAPAPAAALHPGP